MVENPLRPAKARPAMADAKRAPVATVATVAFDVGVARDGDGGGGGDRTRRDPKPRRRSVGEPAEFRQPSLPQGDAKTLSRHVSMMAMPNVV